MASLLKQIDSYPLLKYLLLSIIGATSFLAFSPFNFKLVIVLTHALLLYSVMSSSSILVAFKRSIAWGTGYWLGGTGWLIVSIYFYGNTSIYIALLIIIFMAILLSVVFIGPICLIYLVRRTNNYLVHSLLCAGVLTVIELLRFILLGGFPWLLPGLVLIDTIGQDLIPLIGIYGGSFFVYFISLFLLGSFQSKSYKQVFVGLCLLIIFYPHPGYKQPLEDEGMNIAIIQPSLDPFQKYENSYKNTIESALVNLSNTNKDVDLLIWPESPLPYLNSSQDMNKLLARTNNLPVILSGGWEYSNGDLQNVMSVLGEKQIYAKQHLVIFGEYIPFEGILRGLIEFFDMPMSTIKAGNTNQELFTINGKQVLGLICFDIAFPLSYINQSKKADFIVNISNDTWFGSSYGPYQHLQIVRARALEFNKWIARGTSDGISTIVDNKGTIVSKIDKGKQGVLQGKIYFTNAESYFLKYGFLIIPILSLILSLLAFVLRSRK
ncbi:apolipoprotein N-acyltransferase [Gammaproteobacteria bacterium]|nr:apolipoprotein N-acyltransferase [Gammaproteobacteria bacterium]MDA9268879.1 apolipoprotein N-acyltransferase [Gammaproteobacteria bacterium]MDC1277663.1 apolipoprotein N-acyltransferase [Gammaproteobacteria bacterium]MDC1468960.1 apolipoprotein N-acyltransferase [Gammaproteobacteria bacterium]